VLTPERLARGWLGLISARVFASEPRPLTESDEPALSGAWRSLEGAGLPELHALLPRGGPVGDSEIFHVITSGAEGDVQALVQRMDGQLARCDELTHEGLEWDVSYEMLELTQNMDGLARRRLVARLSEDADQMRRAA
jgi:hypothetical protein